MVSGMNQRCVANRTIPSRGAAAECSPGREPWEHVRRQAEAPEGRKRSLTPLRGCHYGTHGRPRLAPWATFLRRSAAAGTALGIALLLSLTAPLSAQEKKGGKTAAAEAEYYKLIEI